MARNRVIVFALVAVAVGGQVQAQERFQPQFMDGNTLYEDMRSGSAGAKSHATGYLAGVHDLANGVLVCTPYRVIVKQVYDVVQQYLERNPAKRNISAAALSISAMEEVWPCPKDR